jgi:hypothetical protein
MTGIVNRVSAFLTGRGGGGDRGLQGPVKPNEGLFDIGNLQSLSTGLSLASVGATLFGARDQADAQLVDARQRSRAALFDAQEMDLEAQREEVRGKQEANNILDALRQTLAAQRVAFAANGVDTGFGTPVSVQQETRDVADRQLSVTRSDALIQAISRRRQAAALREESGNILTSGRATARNTRRTGLINALGGAAELVQRRADRG